MSCSLIAFSAVLLVAGYGVFTPAVDTYIPASIAPSGRTANTPTLTATLADAATGTLRIRRQPPCPCDSHTLIRHPA